MEPSELSLHNSRIVDSSLKAVQDIVANEKAALELKLAPLLNKMERNEMGMCTSSKHNHNILGQCVGLSRVSAMKVAKLIGGTYTQSAESINFNIANYVTWLKR